MKKTIRLICLLFIGTITTQAQNVFPTGSGTNVGIGTTTPNTKLAIQGDSASVSVSSTFFNYSSGNPVGAQFGTWSQAAGIYFHRWLGTGTLYSNSYFGQATYDNGVSYGLDFKTNNMTAFGNATTSRMYIKTNGNIGIGTTNPSTKLEINSDTTGISGLKFTQLNATSPTTVNVAPLGVDSNGNVVVSSSSVLPLSVIYTSSYPTIDAAIDILNNTATVGTLIVDKSRSLLSSKTLNANKSIKFLNGNVISLNGNTLTINGAIDAGAFQIFAGTGSVNGNPKIAHALPQWWQSITENDWTVSIQKAVDFYASVYFQSQNYTISSSIKLNTLHSHNLRGEGLISSITNTNRSVFAFEAINTVIRDDLAGSLFEGLRINSDYGIQLNKDLNLGDVPENFKNLANFKITDCFFYSQDAYSSNAGTAISMYQVFDSVISSNYFEGFNIAIKMVSCDINTISDNRVMNFGEYAILDLGRDTYGSQNTIIHNDLLGYYGAENKGAYIKSTSRHIIIRDNFLETVPNNRKARAYIDCSAVDLNQIKNEDRTNTTSLIIDITGNRFSFANVIYSYLIRENFKTLNLSEANLITYDVVKSSFCKDLTTLVPVDYISLDVDFIENVKKVINISNCESFGQWHNYSTSKVFSNANNGSVIIDSKSLSTVYDPSKRITFSPNTFRIAKKEVPVWIKIDQKHVTGLNNLPKNIKIIITTRNTSSIQTANNDYYIALVNSPGGPSLWNGFGGYTTNNTTQNNFVKYVIRPKIDINPSDDLSLVLVPTVDVEIKSIEVADDTPLEIAGKINNGNEINDTNNIKIDATEQLKVYPNPADDVLKIEVGNNSVIKSIQVYNLDGKFIKDFTSEVSNKSINVSALPSGNYIVKIATENEVSKIILKR